MLVELVHNMCEAGKLPLELNWSVLVAIQKDLAGSGQLVCLKSIGS
jgi:hypothetical protein